MEDTARQSGFPRRGRTRGSALLTLLLVACGHQEKACDPGTLYTPVPTDCATLSSQKDWTVGFMSEEVKLSEAQSRKVSLWPLVSGECPDSFAELLWTVDDEAIAQVLPDPQPHRTEAWVTGRAPGVTRIVARIRFADGVVRETAPTSIRVVPVEALLSGGQVLAEGQIDIAAGAASGMPWHFVTFGVPARGRVDMILDWDSPLLSANFVLWEGPCSSQPCPGRFIPLQDTSGVKPVQKSTSTLVPGEYTLRIDYSGTAGIVLRYGVLFTP